MDHSFYIDIAGAEKLGVGFFKYAVGPEEHFVSANDLFAFMLGFSVSHDILGLSLSGIFFTPGEYNEFLSALNKNGAVKSFETFFRSHTGEKVCVLITAIFENEGHSGAYISGFAEDITKRKKDEEQLYMEKDFLQNLLDNVPDAVYFKDSDNRLIKVNKFFAQGLGLHPEEIIGKTDFDFFPKEQALKMFEDDNFILRTGRPIVGKIERTILPNNTWNQVITTKIPMFDRMGEIIGTMGITRDMTVYANLERDRLNMLINALEVLVKALEMRDPYTFSHVRHVAVIAEKIAKELGWDQNRLLAMKLAGELHDLGKISIPLDILNKPGKLSDLEYSFVQQHVDRCYDLIKDIDFPFSLAEIVYQHHERLDGSGYPRQLKGDEISFEARILAVSDVLEAMACYRPYREALGLHKAMEELERGSGTKFDKEVVGITREIVERHDWKVFWE